MKGVVVLFLFGSLGTVSHSFILPMLKQKLIKIVTDSGLDRDCVSDLNSLLSDAFEKKLWALKMLDATSKSVPNILNLNCHWLGDFDECMTIDELRDGKNIKGQYCTLLVTINDSLLGPLGSFFDITKILKASGKVQTNTILDYVKNKTIPVGVCIPKSCTTKNLQSLAWYLGQNFNLPFQITIKPDLCIYKDKSVEIYKLDLFVYCFFIIYLMIIFGSTIYDCYLRFFNSTQSSNIFIIFSILSNVEKMFSTKSNRDNTLDCVNGLKVISCFYVVVGHTLIVAIFAAKNFGYMLNEWRHDTHATFILSSVYSITTFFTMNALLRMYLHLKHSENLFEFYFYRFIRITPALFATVFIYTSVIKLLINGPYSIVIFNTMIGQCHDTWWTVFLYYFNFMEYKECALHTWFIAVDSSIYLYTPLIIFFIKEHPKKVFTGIGIALAFGVVYSGWITFVNSLRVTVFDWTNVYLDYLYFSPLPHVSAWLIGILFGYFIFYTKRQFSKTLTKTLWTFSCCMILTLIIGQKYVNYKDEYHIFRSTIWNSLARPAWSLSAGLIIFICATGNGGKINGFLSHPVFRVLSKMSYSMYLTNAPMILLFVTNIRQTSYTGTCDIIAKSIIIYMLTLVSGSIFYLAFEAPITSFRDYVAINRMKEELGKKMD